MKKFSKKLKKGFTLVELVVVIAIIAILSAASVATSERKTTGKAEAQQVMDVIRVAALDESDDSIRAVQSADKYALKFDTTGTTFKELSVLKALLAKNGVDVATEGTTSPRIEQVDAASNADTDGTMAKLKYVTAYYSYTIDFSNFTVGNAEKLI